MAQKGFGAKVTLTVNNGNKTEFNDQINSMIKDINLAKKFFVDPNSMQDVVKAVQGELDKNEFTVKIKKFDVADAVNNVKKELQTMLAALSIKNGINITGMKDFTMSGSGSEDVAKKIKKDADEAVGALNNARDVTKDWEGSMKALSAVFGSTTSAFKKLLNSTENINDESVAEVTSWYETLASSIEKAKIAGSGNAKELIAESGSLKEYISLLISANTAQKKEAETSQAQERATSKSTKAIKMLKDTYSALSSQIKSMGKAGSGVDDDVVAGLQQQLSFFGSAIEIAKTKSELSDDEITSLQAQGVTLRTNVEARRLEVEEIKKKQKAEEKAQKIIEKSTSVQYASLKQVSSLREQISKFLDKNTKLNNTKYADSLNSLLADLNDEAHVPVEKLNQIKDAFSSIRVEAYNAGKTGRSFFETIKRAYEKFGGWSIVTKSLMAAWHQMKNMVEYVHQLDDAMTELKKVTDETSASYENFLKQSAKRAVQNGATMADTITATADYARLGYNLNDASALADASIIYKNVGDGIQNIEDASESIISTMKGFNIEATDVMRIVDVYNEVGNKFAVSSEGIGEILKRSSAALSNAGNSLEQAAAMGAAINEVIQNPEVTGTALKTISMYLRAAKVDAEAAGLEVEGMASSTAALREQILKLTKNKVDIMVDNTTFKETYEIFNEIAKIWKEISPTDQSALIKIVGGGVRNTNAVTALIENFQTAREALNVANGAEGSAAKENEKYLDSISGKMAQLKASSESLASNLFNSDQIKRVVDFAAKIVQIVDKAAELKLIVPSIVGLFTGKKLADRHSCGLPPLGSNMSAVRLWRHGTS